ncbi:MAG: hypothetical protein GX654_14445 [Desulfatiglans sp.]|jgi:hypothetical protein|nr:hypothetical protein [Desulfatiglans sp.]
MNGSALKKSFKFITLTTIFFIIAPFHFSKAVMPADHYREMAENSKIKAIAVINSVKVIKRTRQNNHKRVEFELKHAFSSDVPSTFSGVCYSVDHFWQKPGAGGTIYHYPVKGSTVFVTIAADGGYITGMVTLDEEAEKQMIAFPERIRYGMTGAFFKKSDEKTDTDKTIEYDKLISPADGKESPDRNSTH